MFQHSAIYQLNKARVTPTFPDTVTVEEDVFDLFMVAAKAMLTTLGSYRYNCTS